MQKNLILHLVGMNSTKYGGIEHYLVEVAKLCQEKGYSTVLQYESRPQSAVYLQDLEACGSQFVALPLNVDLIKCVGRVVKLMQSTRPKILVVHFVSRNIFYLAPLVAKIFGVQRVIRLVHSLGAADIPPRSPRRYVFNQYDHILGVSEAITARLLAGGIKPETVSTNYLGLFGVHENRAQLRDQYRDEFNIPNKAILLACIAFESPLKGLDILLKALPQVVSSFPDVYLLIIGVEPSQSELPKLVAELGLTGQIRWAGIRDNGWQILNAADIYVQPSRSEGFPFTIMEAMALKLPVLATAVGGIPEAVVEDQTGYLAEANNVESLARTLHHMLDEPSQWQEMGEAGHQQYLRLFKGETSAKKLVDNYFGLGDQPNSPLRTRII